jgi:hypothetical protein
MHEEFVLRLVRHCIGELLEVNQDTRCIKIGEDDESHTCSARGTTISFHTRGSMMNVSDVKLSKW